VTAVAVLGAGGTIAPAIVLMEEVPRVGTSFDIHTMSVSEVP
jgi:hypothetical protein